MNFVEKHIVLLDIQLTNIEERLDQWEKVASSLPFLISMVNMVDILRGQSWCIVEYRNTLKWNHEDIDQKKLYWYENTYNTKLEELIVKVIKQEDLKNNSAFQQHVKTYLDRWLKKYID